MLATGWLDRRFVVCQGAPRQRAGGSASPMYRAATSCSSLTGRPATRASRCTCDAGRGRNCPRRWGGPAAPAALAQGRPTAPARRHCRRLRRALRLAHGAVFPRSEDNPFFAEEVLRGLAKRGALRPAVRQRLERLPTKTRVLIRTLNALGTLATDVRLRDVCTAAGLTLRRTTPTPFHRVVAVRR